MIKVWNFWGGGLVLVLEDSFEFFFTSFNFHLPLGLVRERCCNVYLSRFKWFKWRWSMFLAQIQPASIRQLCVHLDDSYEHIFMAL